MRAILNLSDKQVLAILLPILTAMILFVIVVFYVAKTYVPPISQCPCTPTLAPVLGTQVSTP
jgi:hypothetical protein